MDNNFNQGQPIQAQPQQPIQAQQQQPVQPQQPQFDPFSNNKMTGNNSSNKINADMLPIISLLLSGIGMFLVFIGTILTCTCSASKATVGAVSTSPVFIVTVFGILFAIAGAVIAILKLKDYKTNKNVNKIAVVGFVLGVFAMIYGILPTVTICGYNCQINNAIESEYEDFFGDYYNPFN